MEKVTIGGQIYEYCDKVRQNAIVCQSFNVLTQQTFGFDFVRWAQAGCWGDQYLPHLLLENGRVVANVSVNLLPMQVFGQKKQYIQLGTVMTAESHRGRGLSRFLMQRVLERWASKADTIYLFANDSAVGFYPKFGFVSATEYEYSCMVRGGNCTQHAIRLDPQKAEDFALLSAKAAQGNCFAELRPLQVENLVLFYALSFYRDSFYYLPGLDIVVAANLEQDKITIYDVYGTSDVPLMQIIDIMAESGQSQAVLGFAPREKEGFSRQVRKEDDETLFVLKGKENPFEKGETMFPLLSHA